MTCNLMFQSICLYLTYSILQSFYTPVKGRCLLTFFNMGSKRLFQLDLLIRFDGFSCTIRSDFIISSYMQNSNKVYVYRKEACETMKQHNELFQSFIILALVVSLFWHQFFHYLASDQRKLRIILRKYLFIARKSRNPESQWTTTAPKGCLVDIALNASQQTTQNGYCPKNDQCIFFIKKIHLEDKMRCLCFSQHHPVVTNLITYLSVQLLFTP